MNGAKGDSAMLEYLPSAHTNISFLLCGVQCFDIIQTGPECVKNRESMANVAYYILKVADAFGTQIYWRLSNKVLNSVDTRANSFSCEINQRKCRTAASKWKF